MGYILRGLLVSLVLVSGAALASPGGLDHYGCHNSKSGYHCHKQKLEKIKTSYAGESEVQRSHRLRAQCQGMPNQGVCFGYSDGQPVKYLN
jgi:hypothetical protein